MHVGEGWGGGAAEGPPAEKGPLPLPLQSVAPCYSDRKSGPRSQWNLKDAVQILPFIGRSVGDDWVFHSSVTKRESPILVLPDGQNWPCLLQHGPAWPESLGLLSRELYSVSGTFLAYSLRTDLSLSASSITHFRLM